jgi:hypothetical protein
MAALRFKKPRIPKPKRPRSKSIKGMKGIEKVGDSKALHTQKPKMSDVIEKIATERGKKKA